MLDGKSKIIRSDSSDVENNCLGFKFNKTDIYDIISIKNLNPVHLGMLTKSIAETGKQDFDILEYPIVDEPGQDTSHFYKQEKAFADISRLKKEINYV